MRTLSTRNRHRSSPGDARPFAGMPQGAPHAAGVDLGAHAIMAGVPDGAPQQLVRAVGTATADLDAWADWRIDRGLQTVARESTGVSWIPLGETLEARGLPCGLLSAPARKCVPGRKSDGRDCPWMQPLQRYGLFKASLRPDADLVALRTLFRHRAQRMPHRAPHGLPMPKALLPMTMQ